MSNTFKGSGAQLKDRGLNVNVKDVIHVIHAACNMLRLNSRNFEIFTKMRSTPIVEKNQL